MIISSKTSPEFDMIDGLVQLLAPSESIGTDHGILGVFLPAGAIVPLHSHRDPETFILLEGEIDHYQDDGDSPGWRTLRPGDLAVLRGGVRHAWRNNTVVACRAILS